MSSWRSRTATGLLTAAAVWSLAGCGDPGDIPVTNETAGDITVQVGDEQVGCVEGDITVTYGTGRTVILGGPVCPGQAVTIGDGTVELVGSVE